MSRPADRAERERAIEQLCTKQGLLFRLFGSCGELRAIAEEAAAGDPTGAEDLAKIVDGAVEDKVSDSAADALYASARDHPHALARLLALRMSGRPEAQKRAAARLRPANAEELLDSLRTLLAQPLASANAIAWAVELLGIHQTTVMSQLSAACAASADNALRICEQLETKPDPHAAFTALVAVCRQEGHPAAALPGLEQRGARGSIAAVRTLVEEALADGRSDSPALAALERSWSRATKQQINAALQAISDAPLDKRFVPLWRVLASTAEAQVLAALEQRWIKKPTPTLARLLAGHLDALSPPRRLEVCLVASPDKLAADAGPAAVQGLLDVQGPFTDIAERVLRSLKQNSAREALCQLGIGPDAVRALKLACDGGFSPRATRDQVVFYTLADRTDEIDVIDSDRTVLRAVYAAEPDLRPRLTRALRQARRTDLLLALAASPRVALGTTAARDDLVALGEELTLAEAWPELLRVALLAPVDIGARLVLRIRESGWDPAGNAHKLFKALTPLAERLHGRTVPQTDRPWLIHRARASVQTGAVVAVDFFSDSGLMLVAGPAGKIGCWDPATAETLWSTAVPGEIRAVAAHARGVAVVSTTTLRSSELHVLSGSDKHSQVAVPSLVTALRALDHNKVLAGSVHGTISLWNPEENSPIDTVTARSSKINYIGLDDSHEWAVAGVDGAVVALRTQSLSGMMSYGQNAAVLCAAIGGHGEIVTGDRDGDVRLLRRGPRGMERQAGNLAALRSPVVGVVYLAGDREVIAVGADQVVAIDHAGGQHPMQGRGSIYTSVTMSPDRGVLALGCSDGSLELLEAVSAAALNILSRPLGEASPNDLAIASTLADTRDDELVPWFEWCRTVLRDRFRTAIGITEQRVASGMHDIML